MSEFRNSSLVEQRRRFACVCSNALDLELQVSDLFAGLAKFGSKFCVLLFQEPAFAILLQ